MSQILITPTTDQALSGSRIFTLRDTTATYTEVVTQGFLAQQQNAGHVFTSNDLIYVSYVDGSGFFTLSFSGTFITLAPIVDVGHVVHKDITISAAALATAGHVAIQASTGLMQFKVRDIFVNYGASGLSGGGGNRLVTVTDGATVYNNAGITAALLGTPVNTVWGGSGNPLPGAVAADTSTAAGSPLYAVYSGGTTDYTSGSVVITVAVERVA